MRRALIVVAVLCTCASCSLFTSLGGYSTDADEPLSDASSDGNGNGDGAIGSDAGGDGSVDGGRFCSATDADLCDDFDDPTAVPFAQWAQEMDYGGLNTVAGGKGFSLPNAFSAQTDRNGDQKVSANLHKTYDNVKRARIAYRFRLDEYDVGAVVQFGQMSSTAGPAISYVRLKIGSGNGRFEGAVYPNGGDGAGTFPDLTGEFPLANNDWHTVDMAVDWESSPARVAIVFDGARLADNAAVTGSTFGVGEVRVSAGTYYRQGGVSRLRVFVDDVSIWIAR